jgi:hypothetical protein
MWDLKFILLNINSKKLQPLIPWDLQDCNIQISKQKGHFWFWVASHSKVLHSKLMKIKCYLEIFTTFGSGFKTKLAIHGSILAHRYKSMSEL